MLILLAAEVTLYWGAGDDWGFAPQPLCEMPVEAKYIDIDFALPTEDDDWQFSDYFHFKDVAQIKQWVCQINARNNGQKVLFSLRDSDQRPWSSVNIPKFVENLVHTYHSWGLGGFDIDAESPDPNPSPKYIALIKMLRQRLPKEAVISYTCYTGSNCDGIVLENASEDINFLNTMNYGAGFAEQVDLFHHYAGQIGDPEKIAIGVMVSNADDGGGTSFDTTIKCAQWLRSQSMRRMMLWTANRDRQIISGQPDGTYLKTILQNLE